MTGASKNGPYILSFWLWHGTVCYKKVFNIKNHGHHQMSQLPGCYHTRADKVAALYVQVMNFYATPY